MLESVWLGSSLTGAQFTCCIALYYWLMRIIVLWGEVMGISVTDRAAEQIRRYLAERGGGLGIRIIVQSSECSGMAYRLEFVDETEEADVVYESCGAKIVVDSKSLVWLEGTVVDYLQIGEENGFSFSNPNVKSQCGCGDSFYV